jgi:HD-like signal output (HDOD) protein
VLSTTTIDEYIESIPPVPKIVKDCITSLNEGDLVKAADIASEDRALVLYLQVIVNKPIFGFRNEISNTRQIFGILGLYRVRQLIYSYYVLLLLPKKWEVFDFDSHKFQDFQARLIHHWSKIVLDLKNEDKELAGAITIIPATLVVCEMLFRSIKDTVALLKTKKNLSYESILTKMTGRTLFEIASLIAKKWEFSDDIIALINSIPDSKEGVFGKNALALEYMRLLLIYEMSRPMMIQSGLSDLFDLEATFDEKITEHFYELVQV